ncbi:heterokaryon incompatibility 6 OR allele [Fusarium subglutinans]|uniref:Heterokaryon incompatibility 6 OR allele n=1 Tax=Gibberella subglutinans TaxID=42677 RepID=A0A8H5QBB9_GIBSU|nr:heterokaryon incompatibility 6 OR allele [Fusarium subglutinans]KAF5611639.1 heterokaryon incompatibility 6 OR allele [Fusarium subglutinans]
MYKPDFKHQPLADPAGQIRLIEVTSKSNKPLELSISTYLTTESPSYHAISYTWGDSGLAEEIIINGQNMVVTENCRHALIQVGNCYQSLPGKPIFIWIDSICINQDDNAEKSHQVAMMGDIFSKASKVLACVGPHQDNSQMLRESMNSIMKLSPGLYHRWTETDLSSRGTWNIYFLQQDFEELEEQFLLHSLLSGREFYSQFRLVFSAFANRRYWRRLWIIQEVVASTRSHGQLEILCGSDSFSRSEIDLCDFIYRATYRQSNIIPQDPVSSKELGLYCCRFALGSHVSAPIPAHMLLERSLPFRCARLEDKIFGVLPMIQWPKGTPPVQPFYEPSPILDPAQLFTSIVKSPRTDIWDVLNALELSHDHELLRPLVEARMESPPQPLGRGKYPSMSFRFKPTFMRISQDSRGQLSAGLIRNSHRAPTDSTQMEAELNGAPKGSVQLFAGSGVCAILCADAHEGDVIIKVPVIGELLVLRRSAEKNEYNIIGQGLLLSNHELPSCPSMVSVKDMFKESEDYGEKNFASYCVIEAEPIEFIVLARQDRGIEGARIERKKLERLATKIYGTVRLID